MTSTAAMRTRIQRLRRDVLASRRSRTDLVVSSPVGLLTASLAATGGAPDPWQREVLASPSHRLLVIAARQSGKSACIAAHVLYAAATRPDSLSLLISASEKQAKELLAKVGRMVVFLGPAGAGAQVSQTEVRLANGARVVVLAASSNAVRGWTVDGWLVLDEAAFIPESVWHASVPSVVAHGGSIMLASSAGRTGTWCHQIHSRPDVFTEWTRWTVRAEDIDRYDKAHLDAERRRLPADLYAAEYESVFSNASLAGAVFEKALIDRSVAAGRARAASGASNPFDMSDLLAPRRPS